MMISVIMPAYNTEQYIKKSIQSVLEQTYRDFELIIVDDGSMDGTGETIQQMMQIDTRIKLITQDNQGVSVARNRGMKTAQGKCISFLDSDDIWEPTFLEKMYNFLMTGEKQLVYSRPDMILPDGSITTGSMPCVDGKIDAYMTKWYELRVPFDMNSFMVKKSLLEMYKIEFDPGLQISEDIGFFMKLLCVTTAYHYPEILSHYVKHEESASSRPWTPKRWESVVLIHESAEKYAKQYSPELFEKFKAMRDYRTYRFIWGTIKGGYIDEALAYITQWEGYLREFVGGNGKWNDRLKCRVLLWKKAWCLAVLRKL